MRSYEYCSWAHCMFSVYCTVIIGAQYCTVYHSTSRTIFARDAVLSRINGTVICTINAGEVGGGCCEFMDFFCTLFIYVCLLKDAYLTLLPRGRLYA